MLTLCGQLVKVKNTFLDRIMAEGAEALVGERPSYTCPEFSLQHDKAHSGNGSLMLGRSLHPQKTASDSLESSIQETSLPATMPQTLGQLIEYDSATPATLPFEGNQVGSIYDASYLAWCDCTEHQATDLPLETHSLMDLQTLPPPADFLTDAAACADWSCNVQAAPSLPPRAKEGCPYMHKQPSRPSGEFQLDVADSDCGDAVASASTMADWDDALTMQSPSFDLVRSPQMLQTRRKRTKPYKKQRITKIWCHFYLDEEMTKNGFDLNKKVIGHGGIHTRSIYQQTDAKLRLRGRGSGHLETDHREAPVHLMLAVTSIEGQEASFLKALHMSAALLLQVTEKYKDFCKHRGLLTPKSPLFWIGELPDSARACMNNAMADFAVSDTMANFGDLQVSVMCESHVKQQEHVIYRSPERRHRRK